MAGITQASRLLATEHAVAGALGAAASPPAAYAGFLAAVGGTLKWQFGVAWEQPGGQVERALRCAQVWFEEGIDAEQLARLTRQTLLPTDSGLAGAAIRQGRPMWRGDVAGDNSSLRNRLAAVAGFTGAVAFPVTGRHGAIGAIEFYSHTLPELDELLGATLSTLGRQLGHFIEQDRAEGAATESEARSRAILEGALDCVVVMEASGRVVQFNPAAERTFGYTEEEAHGREMAELIIPPSLRGRHRRGLRRYLETGDERVIGRRLELTAMRSDGSEFPVEVAIVRVNLDGPPLFAGYLRDISERVASEAKVAALAEEQAALRRVATLVAQGAPPERLFAIVNEEICKLLGADTANLIRYDSDDRITVLAGYSEPGVRSVPTGSKLPIDGNTITARVMASGRASRIDTYEGIPGTLAAMLREEIGLRSSVGAPIYVEGVLWGCVTASSVREEPLPPDAETRIDDFTELVGIAIGNAEARDQLRSSAKRLVEASDEARRRIERNLHDGAQQRLVTLALDLRLVQRKLEGDPGEAAQMLDGASHDLDSALEELRELARGIHPAVLTDHGLGPAVDALAARCSLPVEVSVIPPDRLPDQVEAAAYYVTAEALTNAAKHAQASGVRVAIDYADTALLVEISDDGVGGVEKGPGSGLRGLSDRVRALGGKLEVESPRGKGTLVRATLPLG